MAHTYPTEEFHFPSDLSKYRAIKNLAQFNELVRRESLPSRREVAFESTATTSAEGVEALHIQCKQCSANLYYRADPRKAHFYLERYDQRHQHQLRQAPSATQAIIDRIEAHLALDKPQLKPALAADICTTYRIASRQFEQLYAQASERYRRLTLLYDGREMDELLRRLRSERYEVVADVVSSTVERERRMITKSALFYNEAMAANRQRFGEVCYIALDDRRQLNKWFAGAAMVVGRDMAMLPVALFLVKTIDVDHVKGLLKSLLSLDGFAPATLVTEYAYYWEQAVAELPPDARPAHLIDHPTFVDRFTKSNAARRLLAELAREPDRWKFARKLAEVYASDNFSQFETDLEEFVGLADRVCLSQLAGVVGPYRVVRNRLARRRTDYSVLKQFYRLLVEQERGEGETLYGRVRTVLNQLTDLPREERHEPVRLMETIPSLQKIRFLVTRNVMEQLLAKIYAGLHLRLERRGEDFRAYESREHYYCVRRLHCGELQRWRCECGESEKTMFPCTHELAACVKQGSKINVQVGRRWTNEDEREEEEKKKKSLRKPRGKKETLNEFLA